MFECYENIIGLTDKECECTETNRPADYDESTSTLYLSQLMEIGKLINLGECDDTLWDILVDSRSRAITRFVTESNALLQEQYKLKRQPITAQIIGEIKAKKTVSPTKNYAVVRYNCCPIKSGIMTIKSVGTVFEDAGSFDLHIYDNVSGLLQTISVNTTANKNNNNSQSITLPLYSKYVDQLEYYFVYLFDSSNLPKDTEIDCGCGGVSIPAFDTVKPYYINRRVRNQRIKWSEYVMVGGLQINSLSELETLDDDNSQSENNMYGLNFEVDFTCKVSETLCKDSLDFVGNPLALSLAHCVLYLAATMVAEKITGSSVLSREALIDTVDWDEKAEEWKEKYMEHMEFIVANINLSASDCFECKDIIGMTRQGIFA